MDIRDYFVPVSVEADYRLGEKNSFGSHITGYQEGGNFPDWVKADIAIIGITEYRTVQKANSADAACLARKSLYELAVAVAGMKITDLGNLREGKTVDDSMAALRDVTAALLERNTLPLVLGGSRDLALAMFRAYELNKMTINLTAVDSRAGLAGEHFPDVREQSYLSRIISSRSKHLFNYTNIGYQSYYVAGGETRLLEDMMFDYFRLGMVRENLRETEPVLRDTDLLVISMSSVRQSDAPAALFPSPNGFYGEELCQLAWYGGKSERLTGIAVCDWYDEYDRRGHTARLAAQAAWYFIEGYYKRSREYPFNPSKDCTKYIVNISGPGNEIVFYKSTVTDRWWMEVPSSKLPRNLMVACSYEDYQRACREEVPERWWQNFKKINH